MKPSVPDKFMVNVVHSGNTVGLLGFPSRMVPQYKGALSDSFFNHINNRIFNQGCSILDKKRIQMSLSLIHIYGFQELLKRSDAALILKQKYKGKNPLAIEKDWSSYDKFDYAFKISMMELFFCNKQILSQLDTNVKRKM